MDGLRQTVKKKEGWRNGGWMDGIKKERKIERSKEFINAWMNESIIIIFFISGDMRLKGTFSRTAKPKLSQNP